METYEARTAAQTLMKDRYLPGGALGIGYEFRLASNQTVEVIEGIGSSDGDVTQHRIMPFKFWLESVAVACGEAPDRSDLEQLQTALLTELREASCG